MLKLRCPNCGTNLYRGYYQFPVCHRCGTNALSCRGCLSFDPKAGVCTDVISPIDTVQDADAMPDCGRFQPRYEVVDAGDRPLGRKFWLYSAFGAVVLVFLGFLVHRLVLAPPPRAQHGMRALISVPSQIYPGVPFEVNVLVENGDEQSDHSFQVRLAPETLESAKLESASPPPQRDVTRGKARYLEYDVVPSGAQQRVVLAFTPGEHGRARLRLRVLDERGHWVAEESADVRITP